MGPEVYIFPYEQENFYNSSPIVFAQTEWKARIFSLDHRFYGNSQPFGHEPVFGDFQYLNTTFVL